MSSKKDTDIMKRFTWRLITSVSALFTLLGALNIAHADYPDRAIRLVIGYAPGGAVDTTARIITPKMAEILGQPIVIEYKAGAGGAIASEQVMRTKPDGYTLLVADYSTMVVLPNLRSLKFDPIESFTMIGGFVSGGLVLAVHPSVPARSIQDLVQLLKSSPRSTFNYGTAGVGTGGHVIAELFKQTSGTSMQHIGYRGGAPAMQDLIGGQVPIGMSTLAPAIPQIQAGNIISLGVTSLARAAALPDVPTFAEQGYPEFEASLWYGLVGPKGMEPAVVERIIDATQKALADPTVQQQLRDQGLDAMPDTPEQLEARIVRDLKKFGDVIEKAQIKLE